MKRTVYRLFMIAVLVLAGVILFSPAAMAGKIGILLWSEGSGYPDAKEGIMEQLAKGGFGPSRATIVVESASGSKVKAAEIAQKFASADMDMVIPIGTSAATAVAKEIKNVPVVFSMVFDPVESKIAEDWKSSRNNTTGSSSKVSMSYLVGMLKQLRPTKSIAVLYTPGEKNSEAQLKEIQAVQSEQNVTVIPVLITSKEEVPLVVPDFAERAEAFFLTGSNIVTNAIPTIAAIASKAKVITVTHLGENVEKGVLLGVSANPQMVGRLAGEKAVKVLKGAKPQSIPIETMKTFDVIVNAKTAKEANIDVPASFLKLATRVIE